MTQATSLVPDYISSLAPYEPGKPLEELERELGIHGAVKLASNENPLGASPRALEAAKRALGEVPRYPDGGGHRLRKAIATKYGVPAEEIVLGSGSNDILELAVRAFCRAGVDEVLTHQYAFMMFGLSCRAAGLRVVESRVDPDFNVDVDDMLAKVTAHTKLVYLPNPNNPTGAYLTTPMLERLVDGLPAGLVLVLDEAYVEYARARPDFPNGLALRKRARCHLLTARTFSKAYGLAGLRLGFAVTDREVAGYLNRVRLPFNTTSIAQEAGIAALDDEEHVARSVAANARGMDQLVTGLSPLPVRVYPSVGNFILVDVKRDAGPVYQALLKLGVIVRPLKPYHLPTYLRISIGAPDENARAIAAFAQVLGG